MTVGQAGRWPGTVHEVTYEAGLDTDQPIIALRSTRGDVNPDLTVGVDLTTADPLNANKGLASMGPALGGRGFVVSAAQAEFMMGDSQLPFLRKLTTGRDITGRHRNRFVIDVRDYADEDALRRALPRVYQHLKATVYPTRKENNDLRLKGVWWKFRRSNDIYFSFIRGLKRYLATVETTKHRIFVFVNEDELLEARGSRVRI